MSNSNSNWRAGNNDRRVNLAMAAEQALGGGITVPPKNQGGGGVPRVRGGDTTNGQSNDILGQYMPSQKPAFGQGGSSKGYGFGDDKVGDLGNWQTNKAYNSGNEFNGTGTFGGLGSASKGSGDSLGFSKNTSNANFNNNLSGGESNGFTVQRVRGGIGNPVSQQQQTFGGGQNGGFGNFQGLSLNKNNSHKDENQDIDFQTRQIKKEIDSLDQKLNQKQYSSDLPGSPSQLGFKGGVATFGGSNNINTGGLGSFNGNQNQVGNGQNKNFYAQQKGEGSSQIGSNNGMNNQIFGANNFGLQQSSAQNSNNNFYNEKSSTINSQSTNSSGAPSSGAGSMRPPQKPAFKEDNEESHQSVKKIPANTFSQASNSKKNETENNSQPAKEFLSGTYDPSNILGGNKQSRMRSLGRGKVEPANQHEEKPAQATGNKQIPEQQILAEQFLCPEGCGRSFNKKALEKHIPICKKLFQSKKPEQPVAQKKVEQLEEAQQKQGAKPPNPKGKKEAKAVDSNAKNEALKKLKEAKKKELAETQEKEEKNNDDHHMVNETNGEYI